MAAWMAARRVQRPDPADAHTVLVGLALASSAVLLTT